MQAQNRTTASNEAGKDKRSASLGDFVQAYLHSWLSAMSGPASVPLAVMAFFVSNQIAKVLLIITALVCVWVASYAVWFRERMRVHQLQGEETELKRRAIQAQEEHTAELQRQRDDRDPYREVLREHQKRMFENPALARAATVSQWRTPVEALDAFGPVELVHARHELAQTEVHEADRAWHAAEQIKPLETAKDYDSVQAATPIIVALQRDLAKATREKAIAEAQLSHMRNLLAADIHKQLFDGRLVAKGFDPGGEQAIAQARWRDLEINFAKAHALRRHDKTVVFTSLVIGQPN